MSHVRHEPVQKVTRPAPGSQAGEQGAKLVTAIMDETEHLLIAQEQEQQETQQAAE